MGLLGKRGITGKSGSSGIDGIQVVVSNSNNHPQSSNHHHHSSATPTTTTSVGNGNYHGTNSKRRTNDGSKSYSSFAQRYLEAILDSDVVELIYPPSPNRQRQQQQVEGEVDKEEEHVQPRHPHKQKQNQQAVVSSPSGRSKSSHTTKSTKYTVRTVGSDSLTPTTPSSATRRTTSPIMKLRRKLQQPSSSSSYNNHVTTTTSTKNVQQQHPNQYDVEYRRRSTNNMKDGVTTITKSSPPRNSGTSKGFFHRNNTDKRGEGQHSSQPSPSRSNTNKLSILKWKQNVPRTKLQDNVSAGTSTRPLPSPSTRIIVSSTSSPNRPIRKEQQNQYHRSNHDDDDDDDDDDDSSLTSRHTDEGRRRINSHNRGRSMHREDEENDDDEMTSSYGDDEEEDDQSTVSDDNDDGNPSNHNHRYSHSKQQHSTEILSMVEKTVEDGLDMIFNTNGWACVVPQQDVAYPTQNALSRSVGTTTKSSKKMMIPHNVRDTKQVKATTVAKITTPPPYQRRIQRHYHENSTNTVASSVEQHTSNSYVEPATPRSDITSCAGATEIITNRAVDIAMKRIRGMDVIPPQQQLDDRGKQQSLNEIYQRNNPQNPIRTSSGKPPITRNIVTPDPSLDNKQYATRNHVKEKANMFEQKHRTYQNKFSAATTTSNYQQGKLGQHFHIEKQLQHQNTATARGGDRSVGGGTIKSLSSSVGVEIDSRYHIPDSTGFQMKSSSTQQQRRPLLTESPSDEWMNVELPYEPEISNRTEVSPIFPLSYNYNPITSRATQPIPSTQCQSPLPTRHTLTTTDPCMSPPQIVRRPQQSYDEMSPDPVFCSKSMSMSIQSSILFSPDQSSNNSMAPSFQSDNALFMERADESCSSVVSHIQNSIEDISSQDPVKSRTTSYESGYNPKIVREVSTSRTEATYDSHTEEDIVMSPNVVEQSSSPYMEILGIRGTFPTVPSFPDRTYSTPQQQHHFQPHNALSGSTAPRLVQTAPLDSPSPPPLISDALNLSKELSISRTSEDLSSSINVKSLLRCSPKLKDTSRGGKNNFQTVVAKPEPVRSKPTFIPTYGMRNDPSNSYSSNNALANKLACSGTSMNDSDADGRSIDVKSIRSAFESIIGSHDKTMEKDDDDDTASVRSLRERFEPPKVIGPIENGISKTRAKFEKNINDKRRLNPTSKSHASQILDRRIHHIDVNDTADSSNRLHIDAPIETEIPVVDKSSFEARPVSVADRVRAFNGGYEKSERVQQTKVVDIKLHPRVQSDAKVVSNSLSTTVNSSSPKRSTRKLSSLRAFGGKAFSCGPVKASDNSLDVNGIDIEHDESIEPVRETSIDAVHGSEIGHKCNDIETPNEPMDSLKSTRSRKVLDVTENVDQVAPSVTRGSQYHIATTSKPLWMEQREKILSRSRQSNRVVDAACESRKETELIIANVEKRTMASKVDNDVTYVGEIRHTTLKSSNVSFELQRSANFATIPAVTQQSIHQPASSDKIDQFDFNLHPTYELRRSQSENVNPAYKSRHSTKYDNLLPFCLQTPKSTEDFHTINTNNTRPEVESNSSVEHTSDEKKEEYSYGEAQFSKSSKNTYESTLAASIPGFSPNDSQNDESGPRPIVVKPVARKPYVRPVPLKPLTEVLPAIPFGRSISDPTAALAHSNKMALDVRISEAESRFLPRAMIDKKYATLELPRLMEDVLEPLKTDDIEDSASESSEFSDGVTLDLSIADVSNLTNPTALISKVGGGRREEDQTGSKISDDDMIPDKNYKARKSIDFDVEAKQSEASSSQTSEAAAPLLARALRTFPLSDEISTDSFFRDRAIVAKQQWNLRSASNLGPTSNALFEESSKEDDSRFSSSDLDRTWDIRQVDSLFPTSSIKQIEQLRLESSFGVWQPFPVHFESLDVPKIPVGNVTTFDTLQNNSSTIDGATVDTTPSRSKTPTRRNTSRIVDVITDNKTDVTSTLPSSTNMIADMNHQEEITSANQYFNGTARPNTYLESEASYPLQSTTSSNTNRTVVSHLLSSSTSGASLVSGHFNNLSTISVVSSSATSYGPKHSALLARINALKESRLRRATRMAPRRPSTPLSSQIAIPQPY